jgi:protein-S-isoprenylcysteine O-methyltransferase Ste14
MTEQGSSGLDLATYLVALVYIANFLALTAVAARQAGRSVWLLHRTDVPSQRTTALAFRVSFAVAFLWPAIRLLAEALGSPLPAFRPPGGWIAGLIGHFLVALGAAVALLSQYHMGQSWRIGAAEGEQGPDLVDSGPFALSRNPVFLGQAVLLIGLVLAFPDPVQLSAAVLGLAAIRKQAAIEERVLRATFGKRYDVYAARVPRWLGRPSAPARP